MTDEARAGLIKDMDYILRLYVAYYGTETFDNEIKIIKGTDINAKKTLTMYYSRSNSLEDVKKSTFQSCVSFKSGEFFDEIIRLIEERYDVNLETP